MIIINKRIVQILSALLLLNACNHHPVKSSSATNALRPNTLSEKEKKDGWQLLFDGNSFAGWKQYGGAAVGKAWVIQDSSIHLDAASKKDWQANDGGDIVSAESFGDFHLKYDWKIDRGGNSGVIFYVHEDSTRYQWPWQSGPEMQVLDNEAHPDAKIEKHRAGNLYDLLATASEPVKPALQWNHAEIRAIKGQLDFYLNGIPVLSTQLWNDNWKQLVAGSKFKDMPGFGTYRSGKISLQDHGDRVWYRNIKIRKM